MCDSTARVAIERGNLLFGCDHEVVLHGLVGCKGLVTAYNGVILGEMLAVVGCLSASGKGDGVTGG